MLVLNKYLYLKITSQTVNRDSSFAYLSIECAIWGVDYFFTFDGIELIPNDDDLMKPIEGVEVIEFSQDDFDQLLELQKEIESFDNMDEEANGKCKHCNSLLERAIK